MAANVVPLFAFSLLAIVVAGTLLILLGCWVARAEMPGVLRAAWVNVTGVGAVCLVNIFIMALLFPLHGMLRESSPADAERIATIVQYGLQVPTHIAVMALTYWLLLENLSYRRALVVSTIVAVGLAVIIFLTTYAASSLIPAHPPVDTDRLREARARSRVALLAESRQAKPKKNRPASSSPRGGGCLKNRGSGSQRETASHRECRPATTSTRCDGLATATIQP